MAFPFTSGLSTAPDPPLPGDPHQVGSGSLGHPLCGTTAIDLGLRRKFFWLLLLLAVASAFRSPQYLIATALPTVLIFATPRVASRVLLFFVAVLVVVGGLVTTYREGMVEPQWPQTRGEGMLEYSLADMLATGWGLTLEHSHRVWAFALGVVAIVTLMTTFVHRSPRSLKIMAGVTLGAITFQGLLGGFRVLEVSQNLAFLHGTIAQAVVALIAVLCVMASHTFQSASRTTSEFARGAHLLGPWVAGLMYLQFALGAWVRHHGSTVALLVHGTYALAVVVMVLVLSKQLGIAAAEGKERGVDRRPLGRLQFILLGAVSAQFILGILATVGIYMISGGMQAEVSVGEAFFATSHVFVGAILFSTTVVSGVYARRMLLLQGADGANSSQASTVPPTEVPA